MQQVSHEGETQVLDFGTSGEVLEFQRAVPPLFLVDQNLRIVLRYDGSEGSYGASFIDERTQKFISLLDDAVREMVGARWPYEAVQRVLRPLGCVVAAFPLRGKLGRWLAITVQPLRNRNSLARAAAKFALTRREVDVLEQILDGRSATEIGAMLNIAETTVQGYFKQLLSKTDSRSRATMVAKVLDWEGREASSHPRAI